MLTLIRTEIVMAMGMAHSQNDRRLQHQKRNGIDVAAAAMRGKEELMAAQCRAKWLALRF